MKIKWLIILAVALIAIILLSLFLAQINTKILTPGVKENNIVEQPVILPQEIPVVVPEPSSAQPVNRAITIIKAPVQNEEVKTENRQDLTQPSSPQESSNPASVSEGSTPVETKAGTTITKPGKEATPEEIKTIKSKGIIIL